MKIRLTQVVCLVAAFAAGQSYAQTAVQDVEARTAPDASRTIRPLKGPDIQFTSQRPPTNADEIRFQLNDIRVVGSTAYDAVALSAIYADDLGAEVALTRIYEIAGEIQGRYRADDYIFTRVVVPAQEIDSGVVRLEVIEAVIAAVSVEEPEGEVGPVVALAERMLARLVGVVNPTGALLERALLNVNEIPGMTRATAVPQAASEEERGALNLFVNVERDNFVANFYADNKQTPGIGRGLAGASVTFNSYSADADTTTLSVFNSFGYKTDVSNQQTGEKDGAFDFDERHTFQLIHQRHLTEDGLVARGQALYSRTKPNDNLAEVGIEGEQLLLSAELDYPLYLTRETIVQGRIGFEYFDSETDISNGAFRVADDRLRVLRAGVEGVHRDEYGYTRIDFGVRQGLDILDATSPNSQTRSRNDGESEFTLVRAEVERVVELNEDLTFFVMAGGQYSLDPLLAAEEFAIGGLSYGRGFDPSEFTGDHGVGISGELRYLTPVVIEDWPLSIESYAFVDYGKVWNRGVGQENADLLSAGGGVRLFLPEQTFLGLEVAFPIDQPLQRVGDNGERVDGARVFVTFSKQL